MIITMILQYCCAMGSIAATTGLNVTVHPASMENLLLVKGHESSKQGLSSLLFIPWRFCLSILLCDIESWKHEKKQRS